jgi:hypothetical protein
VKDAVERARKERRARNDQEVLPVATVADEHPTGSTDDSNTREKIARTLTCLLKLMQDALEKHNINAPENRAEGYELECGPFVLRYEPPGGLGRALPSTSAGRMTFYTVVTF